MSDATTPDQQSQPDTLSHRALIRRAGGYLKVAAAIVPEMKVNTVKGWDREDSIPGSYWQALEDAGLASLAELAAAAHAKKLCDAAERTAQ